MSTFAVRWQGGIVVTELYGDNTENITCAFKEKFAIPCFKC